MNKILTALAIVSILLMLNSMQTYASHAQVLTNKEIERMLKQDREVSRERDPAYVERVNSGKKLVSDLIELCPHAETKFEKKFCILQIKPLLNDVALQNAIASKIQILKKIHTEFSNEFKNTK